MSVLAVAADGSRRVWSEDLYTLAWLHAEERPVSQWLALEASGFPIGLALVPEDDPASLAMAAALVELRAAAEQCSAGLDDLLAADYAAIYLTYALRASPCESVWRDEDHLLLQRPTFDVRAALRAHGVAVPNWRRMPEDHIANELSFLGYLVERDKLAAAAQFLERHVLAWLPQFAERVSSRAGTPIYAALAGLTHHACRSLQARLPKPVAAAQV